MSLHVVVRRTRPIYLQRWRIRLVWRAPSLVKGLPLPSSSSRCSWSPSSYNCTSFGRGQTNERGTVYAIREASVVALFAHIAVSGLCVAALLLDDHYILQTGPQHF